MNILTCCAILGINLDYKIPDVLGGGITALYYAAQECQAAVVQELIDRGASVDEATKDGATPLFIASEFGCLYVCVPYSYVSVYIYLCSTNQRLVLTPCVLNPPTHPPISAMAGVKRDHPVHHSSTFIKEVHIRT